MRLYDRYVEVVTGIFDRGVKDGSFDTLDPFYLTMCFEGIINAFVAYWSRREPTEPLDVRIEKIKDAFIGRIRRGPAPT